MKKFLHTSIIQGKATPCEEQVTCRELNAQDLALVVGGTALHGGEGHDWDDHRRDWDDHRRDWDDHRRD